ncbi:MAG: RNA-binding S4 domain-containing protein [Parvularculaceae bacterium]
MTSQRLDQWLWYTRFYKTRTLAGKIVGAGDVRVTRGTTTTRATKASYTIQPDDTLTFQKDDRLRIIRILDLAKRRGPAPEAQTLYQDLSPPPEAKADKSIDPFEREKGSGRPTKKDRRVIDALRRE